MTIELTEMLETNTININTNQGLRIFCNLSIVEYLLEYLTPQLQAIKNQNLEFSNIFEELSDSFTSAKQYLIQNSNSDVSLKILQENSMPFISSGIIKKTFTLVLRRNSPLQGIAQTSILLNTGLIFLADLNAFYPNILNTKDFKKLYTNYSRMISIIENYTLASLLETRSKNCLAINYTDIFTEIYYLIEREYDLFFGKSTWENGIPIPQK